MVYRKELYICPQEVATKLLTSKTEKMKTTKTLVRLVNGKEVTRKEYATIEAATNAGNSWTGDCTVDQNIRKKRSFEVI